MIASLLCSKPSRADSPPLKAAGALYDDHLLGTGTLDIAEMVQVVPQHSTCRCLAPQGSRLFIYHRDVFLTDQCIVPEML